MGRGLLMPQPLARVAIPAVTGCGALFTDDWARLIRDPGRTAIRSKVIVPTHRSYDAILWEIETVASRPNSGTRIESPAWLSVHQLDDALAKPNPARKASVPQNAALRSLQQLRQRQRE